jgi:outer membrane protein OmpA-like peptidoglycan-associated protein
VTILKGTITDAVSKRPLSASIEILDIEQNKVVGVFQSNAATGRYLVSLPSGANYGIVVQQPGYLLHSLHFELPATAAYTEVAQDIVLNRPNVGATVELRNIFFVPAQAELRPQSTAELARLKKLLTEHPTLLLELSGEVNAMVDGAASRDLAQQRAQAVLAYLTTQGIAPSRLSIASSPDAAQPVASAAATPTQQISRPTEFKVVGGN